MYYTIYKITNQIDGKVYIGSHKTKKLDDDYMGSGKYLIHAQEKYGIENFVKEILFVFDTPEEMYAKELELVNEDFLAMENTYNLKVGGFGGWDYINKTLDLAERNRVTNSNRNYSDQTFLEKMRVVSVVGNTAMLKTLEDSPDLWYSWHPKMPFAGKNHTEETKKKIGSINSTLQSKDKNSQFDTMWITNGIESKKIHKNLTIPIGWSKGRKIKKAAMIIDNPSKES